MNALALEPIKATPKQHSRCVRFGKRGELLFKRHQLRRTRYQWVQPEELEFPLGYINPETSEWNFMDPTNGDTYVTRNGNVYQTKFHLKEIKYLPKSLPESISQYMELRPKRHS
jgi:hypothetical protein